MGNHRTQRYTQGSHRRIDRQDIADCHIHHIHDHIRQHGADRVLHANEPALNSHQRQCRRRSPHTNKEVFACEGGNFSGTGHNRERRRHKEPLHQPYQRSTYQSNTHTLRQETSTLLTVIATKGLRRHTARTDTQETEVPIKQIKEHRTNGYTANGMSIGNMSHDSRIHQSHQRNSDIGKNTRNS